MPSRSLALRLVLAVAILATAVAMATPEYEAALERQIILAGERPYDAAVHNDLGNLLLLLDQEADAEAAYRRALELDGRHLRARFNLGLLMQQKGEHREALEHFAVILEQEPRHAKAHYQKGASLQELDRRKDAIEHYSRAFALDPKLSFAENNPHIIDNTMVTEALLMSNHHGGVTGRGVARVYEDRDRIAQIMVEKKAEAQKAAAEAAAKAAAEAAAMGERSPVQQATAGDGTRPGSFNSGRPLAPAGGETDRSEDSDDEVRADHVDRERTITEDDLSEGIHLGGVVGGPSATRPDVRDRPRSEGTDRTPAAPRVLDGERAPSGNLGRERYRPSRRSSASLDLELLPIDEAERQATGA